MKLAKSAACALAIGLVAGLCPGVARGQSREMDVSRSSLKILVFKSGLFSAFGHNHEIEAPLEAGAVEFSTSPRVRLRFDARKLSVLDPDLAADKRAEVQKTMLGPEVLDASRFPEITFQSTAIQSAGADHWKVTGDLTLHGQTHSILVDVALKDGHYRGSATIQQRSFGIEPVSAAGGTVKVKDEVKVEFDIVLKQ
jgi:hypothetical protein